MTTTTISSPWAVLGRVITPETAIDDGAVVINGDRIVWVGERAAADAAGYAETVKAGTRSTHTVLPGLVDIHCHGGGGASFPDALDAQTACIAAREHLAHGTTSLVASLVTADRETLLARVATLTELADAGDIAAIHLEGPFLSAGKCGAQDPNSMQQPDAGLVREVARRAQGHFATMTVAPEIPGQDEVIEALIEVGALPSLGHTDASYEQTEHAVAVATAALATAGENARSSRITATHLFNGMRVIHHRDPGPVMACLAAAAKDLLVVELVADGTHLADGTVRAVFELLGPDRIMLVTDAMAAAGMPDGQYDLGPMKVTVKDRVARLTGGDSIAGGTARLIDEVRQCVLSAGLDVVDVLRAAATTPATVLGVANEVGALRAGLRADVVVVDDDYQPIEVIKRGVRVDAQ